MPSPKSSIRVATGAPVVMTGRVADPSLFLGTMLHGLGWRYDDYPRLAVGTLAGHLMECAAQVTGGCFIDPGKKDCDDAVDIGFPYADIREDGSLVLGKLEDSGGRSGIRCGRQYAGTVHRRDPPRSRTLEKSDRRGEDPRRVTLIRDA